MTGQARRGAARPAAPGWALLGGRRARGVVDHLDGAVDAVQLVEGFWAVVADFEGRVRAWRFAEVEPADRSWADPWDGAGRVWRGPAASAWTSSMGRDAYCAGVESIRSAVRDGDVYQVNLCRVLSAPLPPGDGDGAEPDAGALAARLAVGNPSPYAGVVHVPAGGVAPPVWVVTASPELYLRVDDGWVTSGPIKGTAVTPAGLGAKDAAENVMIADLVRNDLQRVCVPGTVEVTDLLAVERHPGLVHLVTTVRGRLVHPRPGWPAVLAATYPPASVSGAPKHAALGIIADLEPEERGPYCGAVGWVDADSGRAELAVGIRTFWWTPEAGGTLRFGTGAGITWGSVAADEWAETELKAARLVGLASR
jgi:para-aminobenzoate synthetase component 1